MGWDWVHVLNENGSKKTWLWEELNPGLCMVCLDVPARPVLSPVARPCHASKDPFVSHFLQLLWLAPLFYNRIAL